MSFITNQGNIFKFYTTDSLFYHPWNEAIVCRSFSLRAVGLGAIWQSNEVISLFQTVVATKIPVKTSKTLCPTLAQMTVPKKSSPFRPLGTMELRQVTQFTSTVFWGFVWQTRPLQRASALPAVSVLVPGKRGQQWMKRKCIACLPGLLFWRTTRKRKKVRGIHFCDR